MIVKSLLCKEQRGVLFLGVALLLMNISGDHVFNKTDYLKLALLSLVVFLFYMYHLLNSYSSLAKQEQLWLYIFALSPSLATIPGTLINNHHIYMNGFLYEWVSRVVMSSWFCTCILTLPKSRPIDRLIQWVVGIVLFVCFVALLEAVGFDPQLRLFLSPYEMLMLGADPVYQGTVHRVQSTFGNPNYFSAFVVMATPLVFTRYFFTSHKEKYFRNVKYTLLMAIIVLAMMSAGTRAAILGGGLSLSIYAVVLFYIKPESRRVIFIGLVSIALFSIMALLNVDNLTLRFSQLVDAGAWLPRINAWNIALASIASAPVAGFGLGASYPLFFEYVSSDYSLFISERSFNHAHNQWLEVLQEGGFLGLIFYLIFWVAIYLAGISVVKSKAEITVRLYALSALCGLTAYHFHSLFSVAERMVVVNVFAYFLSALIVVFWLTGIKGNVQGTKIVLGFEYYSKTNVNCRFWPIGSAVVLVLSCSWLVHFCFEQNIIVKTRSGAVSQDELLYQATRSNNVYVLYEGLLEAVKSENGRMVIDLSRRLNTLFPHYKDVSYYQSYAHAIKGDVAIAKQLAEEVHARDSFHVPTLHLLAWLALQDNNVDDFAGSLKYLLKLRLCKAGIVDCSTLLVRVSIKETQNGVALNLNSNELEVLISPSFIKNMSLLIDRHKPAMSQYGLSWARMIGDQGFFYPRLSNRTILLSNSPAYSKLVKLINVTKAYNKVLQSKFTPNDRSLLNQVSHYRKWSADRRVKLGKLMTAKRGLKSELISDGNVDVEGFLRRRELLHLIASDLVTIGSIKTQ